MNFASNVNGMTTCCSDQANATHPMARAVLREPLDRKALKAQLRAEYGVSLAGEVYEDPIQKQPVFERYADAPLPISEEVCARHVCLPVFSGMTDEQAHQVIDALKRTIG